MKRTPPADMRRVNAYPARMVAHIVEGVIDACRREIRSFADLPDGFVQTHLRNTAVLGTEDLLSCIHGNRSPLPDEVRRTVENIEKIMDKGVPLPDMLWAARLGARVFWEVFLAELEPSGVSADTVPPQWMTRTLEYLDAISTATSSARSTHQATSEPRREVARMLGKELLSEPNEGNVRGLALELGLSFSDELIVAVLPVDLSVDIEHEVGRAGVATQFEDRTVVFLDVEVSDAVLGALARRVDGPIAFSDPRAWESGLKEALEEVSDVADLAAWIGMRGLVSTDQLVAERLLVADPEAARKLYAETLGTLAHDRSGVLLETIRAFIESGSASAAAERLHVHPHTVSYRLTKAREAWGVDLDDPEVRFRVQLALRANELLGTQDSHRSEH